MAYRPSGLPDRAYRQAAKDAAARLSGARASASHQGQAARESARSRGSRRSDEGLTTALRRLRGDKASGGGARYPGQRLERWLGENYPEVLEEAVAHPYRGQAKRKSKKKQEPPLYSTWRHIRAQSCKVMTPPKRRR